MPDSQKQPCRRFLNFASLPSAYGTEAFYHWTVLPWILGQGKLFLSN